MAAADSSSDIRSAGHKGNSADKLNPESYYTPSVELSNFAPFGTVIDAIQAIDEPPRRNSPQGHSDEPCASEQPPASADSVVDSFPDGGTRSWLVVLGSFSLLMASYGMLNTVGVFQSYLEANQLSTYSSTDVGWITSAFIFVTLLLGVYIGPLFDSYGPKMLVYAGSAIFMLSFFLFAECTQYWQFLLCFGIVGGIGSALVSTVAMACIPHWFEMRAGVAMGTALAGPGLGGAVFPFALRAGFSNIGFKWTMRTIGFVIGFLCLLGSIMVRSRLPRRKASKVIIDLRCFKDLKFTWMTFSNFCLEVQYFSFLGLYLTFITAQGFSTNTSIYLVVIMNVCGILGRLLAGRVADRYGRLNVLTLNVILGTILLFGLLYPFSKTLSVLYAFSSIYGLSTGSFMSLSPVCIRQMSDTSEFGLRFGTCYSVISFGLLFSIPVTSKIMQKGGPNALVLWAGALLVWTTALLALTRWTCLGYNWKWKIVI